MPNEMATSILDTLKASGVLSRLEDLSGQLAKDDSAGIKVTDIEAAIKVSSDATVADLQAKRDAIAAKVKELNAASRDYRNQAASVIFPSFTASDDLDDDTRAELVAEAKDLRGQVVAMIGAARTVDPDLTDSDVPSIPDVAGLRGRKPGSAGASGPRVHLESVTVDGVSIGSPCTIGNLRSYVRGITDVDLENSVYVDALLSAAGVGEWQSAPKGVPFTFPVSVNKADGTSVTLTVVAVTK